MSEETPETVETKKTIYGVKGGQKPPNSGRKKGTPNKRRSFPIEEILEQVAEDLNKEGSSIEVMAIWRLYMVLHRQDEKLGLAPGTITPEMSLQAAFKLMPFELPKKRSIEVTGLNFSGEQFVISTGAPKPAGETNSEWAERAQRETLETERNLKEKRLAELEAQKEAEKTTKH